MINRFLDLDNVKFDTSFVIVADLGPDIYCFFVLAPLLAAILVLLGVMPCSDFVQLSVCSSPDQIHQKIIIKRFLAIFLGFTVFISYFDPTI